MQSEPRRHGQIISHRLNELPHHCEELVRAVSQTAAGRNLHDTFSQLLTRLHHYLRFDYLGFGLFSPERNVETVLLQSGEYEFPPEFPVLETSLGVVLNQRQAIEVPDVENDGSFPDLSKICLPSPYRSFRVVPLATDRQTLGSLAVARKSPGKFSAEDISILDHAGQLVSLVLENTLMADVLGREKARLETLLDINRALSSRLDIQKLLVEISTSMRRLIRNDYTHLALHDPTADAMKSLVLDAENRPVARFCSDLVPIDKCPSGIAFRKGELTNFTHAELQAFECRNVRDLLAEGIRSVCYLPLISDKRPLGVLGLASSEERVFSDDEVALLRQVAGQISIAVENARAHEEIARLKDRLSKEKLYLEDELSSAHNFGEVVGNSPALCHVLKQVEIAAPSDATVLLLGETGTGKELVARAVHRLSARRDGNFIKLNCAAIPTGLLESELFGHEKGAFTGAVSQKVGRLELADKGTLFLDEIGEIPTELQPKLLRVLQDQEFERLGGVRTIKVNVRVVAATNRDLAQAVADHQFRSDLFYRLNVFPIRLPALRERTGDIPLLAQYFIQKFARRMGKRIDSIPVDLIQELEHWHWPGNIRELENFIERSVILTQGSVFYAPMAELRRSSPDHSRRFGTTLEDVEREYILRTLREAGGVIAGARGAAARLGMKRTTLQSRLHKLGIDREEYQA